MKLALAAVALTFFAIVEAELTIEQLKKLRTYREDCLKLSGADPEIVASARRGSIVDDPKLEEHLFCMFKKIGIMNEQGEPQKDVLRKKLIDVIKEEPLADTLIGECLIESTTPQLTALESFKCFFAKTGLPIV